MKSQFQTTLQLLAAVACTMALTACGGGSSNPAAPQPAVAQPALKTTDTVTGTGAMAAAGDLLVVNYVGYLYDSTKAALKGAKFDSSIDRNVPFTFTIGTGKVISGWDQGILGMRVGGKRTLVVPAAMAYGANSRDAQAAIGSNTYAAIPANSPLIFDVELVSVVPATIPVAVPPPSTLTLQDSVIGTGTEATAGKSITVHYTGYLYDGTRADLRGYLFDTDSGKTPLGFKLGDGKVIKGFDNGVLGMKVGGKRKIIIPPSQGYGAIANGAIPANSTLVFDVELLTVQ